MGNGSLQWIFLMLGRGVTWCTQYFCWGTQHVGWNGKNVLHPNNINKATVLSVWPSSSSCSCSYDHRVRILLLPILTVIVGPFIVFFLFLQPSSFASCSSSSSYDASSSCPNIMVIVPTMMPYFSLSLILTFSLLCLSLFFYSISISSNHARYTQLLSLEQTYSHNPRSAASPLSFGTLAATTYILRRFFISFFG